MKLTVDLDRIVKYAPEIGKELEQLIIRAKSVRDKEGERVLDLIVIELDLTIFKK